MEIDLCDLAPTQRMSIKCQNSSLTELKIMGDKLAKVLAHRVLALLAFLLFSPSVVAQSKHDWREAPYSWQKGPSPDSIVVGFTLVIFVMEICCICFCCWGFCTNANPQEAAGPEPASVAAPRVLDQHTIELFPLLSFQSDRTVGFGESNCVICFEEFMERGNIRALPCGHVFHPDCIDTWLTSTSTKCPVCRHDYSG